jgi:hypothetical protein
MLARIIVSRSAIAQLQRPLASSIWASQVRVVIKLNSGYTLQMFFQSKFHMAVFTVVIAFK